MKNNYVFPGRKDGGCGARLGQSRRERRMCKGWETGCTQPVVKKVAILKEQSMDRFGSGSGREGRLAKEAEPEPRGLERVFLRNGRFVP